MQANQIEQVNRVMSSLLRFEKRLRTAESAEQLRIVAVNELITLVSYEQALMGSPTTGPKQLSGLSEIDINVPYVDWAKKLLKQLKETTKPRYLTSNDVSDKLRSGWQEWLPTCLAVVPVMAPSGNSETEFLLLARAQPFSEAEKKLLSEIADLLGFHLGLHRRRRIFTAPKLRWLASAYFWAPALLAATLVIPVKLSVLAQAEIVAKDPAVIRAPLDGVVSQVFVKPNQTVAEGELILKFDARALEGEKAVAQSRLETAQASYRQMAQKALFEGDTQGQLVVLQADIEAARLEIERLNELLSRTEVRASMPGQMVMQSSQDWIGRPVALGERLMQIADVERVAVRGWLSPSDQVPIAEGSPVTLFSNALPDAELVGNLNSIGYQVQERADGSFAFPIDADLDLSSTLPPIGSKGTLRLEGETVSLAYLLIRRPLALMRQWLGL